MILAGLLTLIVLVLIVITVIVVSIGGALGIILFGDVIVCIAILIWIIKKLIFRKNTNKAVPRHFVGERFFIAPRPRL